MRRWGILLAALTLGFGLQSTIPGRPVRVKTPPRWVRFIADGGPRGELTLRCDDKWGLSVALFDGAPDLLARDPALAHAAARESAKFTSVDYGGALAERADWRFVSATPTEAVVVFGDLGESVPIRLRKVGGTWRFVEGDICGVEVGRGGRGAAHWGIPPTQVVLPEATSIPVLVSDATCSELSAEGRVDEPVIRYSAQSVVITFTVSPPRRVRNQSFVEGLGPRCASKPPVPYVVHLREPIGG